SLFGFERMDGIRVDRLLLSNRELSIGDETTFSFELMNSSTEPIKLRVEYGIDFTKKNGSTSRKLFKITENVYVPGTVHFSRRHSFADLSTRKHYPGLHRLAIVIN